MISSTNPFKRQKEILYAQKEVGKQVSIKKFYKKKLFKLKIQLIGWS